MIDGEELAAFVAIADLRSFSRAADRLGIVQSVASKRLRRLEDRLGTQLVDRSVRTAIRLTREGQIFLPQAVEALARIQTVERMGRSLGRGSSGPFRIGFVFSAAMSGVLGRILAGVRQALPDIELVPRLMETPAQLAALDSCQLDMALVRSRPSYPPDCRAVEIVAEELVICLSAGHALATASSLLPAQLAGQCFIVPQFHEQVGLVDGIRRLSEAGGFPMPHIVRTDDFVTAACLASAGEGVVLAPTSLARLGLDGVRFLAVDNFPERMRLMLVYRTDAPRAALDVVLRIVDGGG